MKLLAFVVKDEKSDAFAHPYFAGTIGLAIREFDDWCKNPQTPLGKHPGDYTLYHIGYFDDETARLESEVTPVRIANGADAIPPALKAVN